MITKDKINKYHITDIQFIKKKKVRKIIKGELIKEEELEKCKSSRAVIKNQSMKTFLIYYNENMKYHFII